MKETLRTVLLLVAALPGSASAQTATPVQHLVVIFDENVSFDHYFATYPHALNLPQEAAFKAREGTPPVNGLTPMLLEHNPNFLNVKVNQAYAVNPFRLGPAQAATADQNHGYTEEQLAFHAGLMDSFPQYTGLPGTPPQYTHQTKAFVMAYFDGNTVTDLWNYADR
jgi:phospholipase C